MSYRFVIGRIGQAIPVLILVVVLSFLMIRLVPGNPGRQVLGPRASSQAVAAINQQLGVSEALPTQLWNYVSGLAHADLGYSVVNQRPVSELVNNRIGPTALLVIYSAILVILLTVPLAFIAASRPNGILDHLIGAIPVMGIGLPTFWFALILILLFSVNLNWFPVGGYESSPGGVLRSLFLPAVTVAVSILPFTIRGLRIALIDVLGSDYIAAARARGLPRRTVLIRHALRNAIIPVIVVLGLNIGWLVGNTLVVEKVFAIPGLGSLLFDSVLNRDYRVVQAATLLIAILVIAVNVITDIARVALDPRVQER